MTEQKKDNDSPERKMSPGEYVNGLGIFCIIVGCFVYAMIEVVKNIIEFLQKSF